MGELTSGMRSWPRPEKKPWKDSTVEVVDAFKVPWQKKRLFGKMVEFRCVSNFFGGPEMDGYMGMLLP